MRVPGVKFTTHRVLIGVIIISLLAGLLIERVSAGGWWSWVLTTVALASPILFFVCLLAEVLRHDRQRGEQGLRATRIIVALRPPHFALWQLMLAMGIVTVMCWL